MAAIMDASPTPVADAETDRSPEETDRSRLGGRLHCTAQKSGKSLGRPEAKGEG
jgi:hypothetical protein